MFRGSGFVKKAQNRQLFENASESRTHEHLILRAPPSTNRKELFASAEGASEKNLEDFHLKCRQKSVQIANLGVFAPRLLISGGFPPQNADSWGGAFPPRLLIFGSGPNQVTLLATKAVIYGHRVSSSACHTTSFTNTNTFRLSTVD